jgi:Glycosyltransferase family 28 C-terminal domain
VYECLNEENSNSISRCWRGTSQRGSCATKSDYSTTTRLGSAVSAVSGSYGSLGCPAQVDRDSYSRAVQHSVEKRLDTRRKAVAASFAGHDQVIPQTPGEASCKTLWETASGFNGFRHTPLQPGNRRSLEKPFVTIITDLADFPPHFWIEPTKEQYVLCGTARAVEQAKQIGKTPSQIFATSGMILRPDFYVEDKIDPILLRKELNLRPDLTTGILLFGGFGSTVMYEIVERLEAANLPVQLIVICGRNEKLADRFRSKTWKIPLHVVGFTKEVHRLMRAADFLIGKPGPGSVAEAMVRKLPVILECNAWTLPQERYNTEWVKEQRVGIVLNNFKEIINGVTQILEPGKLVAFRKNTENLDNRAIFEIPEIFAKLMGESSNL